jgi:hypothetical protein
MRLDQRVERGPALCRLVGGEEAAAWQRLPDRVDHGPMRRVDDQSVRAGIVDDVAEFRPAEPEVERHENSAEAGGGEQSDDEGGLVKAQECDAITLADTVGAEGIGLTVDTVLKFGIDPGHALECQSLAIRSAQGPLIQPVAKPDVWTHGVSPLSCPLPWACATPRFLRAYSAAK